MKPAPEHIATAGYFSLLFDLSRSYQSLLSLSQPLLGAIIALRGFPGLRVLILGLIAATAGYLAVFALNDVLDRKVDAQSIRRGKAARDKHDIGVTVFKHPLARGDLSLAASLAWVTGMGLIGGFFAFLLNPLCLWLFLGCIGLEIMYCSLRSVSWLKTLTTGAMVGMGGMAGWAAVAPLTRESFYFFLFIAFWEIAGRNLANDLADVDSDRKVGLKTVATVFGNRVSSVAILVGAIATVALTLTLPLSPLTMLVELALGIWCMGAPAITLARSPSSMQASSYFNRASLFPMLVLIALLPFILAGNL